MTTHCVLLLVLASLLVVSSSQTVFGWVPSTNHIHKRWATEWRETKRRHLATSMTSSAGGWRRLVVVSQPLSSNKSPKSVAFKNRCKAICLQPTHPVSIRRFCESSERALLVTSKLNIKGQSGNQITRLGFWSRTTMATTTTKWFG